MYIFIVLFMTVVVLVATLAVYKIGRPLHVKPQSAQVIKQSASEDKERECMDQKDLQKHENNKTPIQQDSDMIQQQYQLTPDRMILVNLERISYKLTQSLIQLSKKSMSNTYEIQRIMIQTDEINTIFLNTAQLYKFIGSCSGDFEEKRKFEGLFKQLIELNIQRYDLYFIFKIDQRVEVSKLAQILHDKFGQSKIDLMKRAYTYFYRNLQQNQGQISKILNVHAEKQNKTLQFYLEDCFAQIIDDLTEDDPSIVGSEMIYLSEVSFIQLMRIYSEQLQILFRYNSVQGILVLFKKQLQSIPRLHRAKQAFLDKNKPEQQGKINYPDIHTICLVVKCLIREKAAGQALRVTQFFKDNCMSDRGEQNIMEVPETQHKEDYDDLLVTLTQVKDIISFDINTFFLNGVIIELNSRHLYQHAIRFFQWMDRNTNLNHRPNTSTYNMVILVYGSMQDFHKSKQIFDKMQDQLNSLNTKLENMDIYEEIYQVLTAPKNKSRTSSQIQKNENRSRTSSQIQKNNESSDSDEDQYAHSSSNKDLQMSPQHETSQFKHASDAIQKHFNLQFPPTNINTFISLVNTLNRQRLFNQIVDLLLLAKSNQDKAIHPLLREDLNDFGPLYQSIVKNLLLQKRDDIKFKACQIAVESLDNNQIIKDGQLYMDCQTYLQQQLKIKKNPQIALLEERLSVLIEERDIEVDKQSRKSSGGSKRVFKKVHSFNINQKNEQHSYVKQRSNDSSDNFSSKAPTQKGYTSDSRSFKHIRTTNKSDFDDEVRSSTPNKRNNRPHQTDGLSKFKLD